MTGMNRKEFCKFFNIPYRTVTEWELDNRHAPEYVLRLLEYYIRSEGLIKSPADTGQAGERSSSHAPEYVLRLLEYYIRNEGLIKSSAEQKHAGERSSSHEKTD